MKKLLTITVCSIVGLTSSVAFAAECSTPPYTEDFISLIELHTSNIRVELADGGNMCGITDPTSVMGEGDMSLDFSFMTNPLQSQLGQTLAGFQEYQDFEDSFLSALPFLDRPYALTYDVERATDRLDRLWEMVKKSYRVCNFEVAKKTERLYGEHTETLRQLRNAAFPTYKGLANPFYIGMDPNAEGYAEHAATYKDGYYFHPSQQKCQDGSLNLAKIGERLEKIGKTFTQAGKEIENEFTEQVEGVQETWDAAGKSIAKAKKGYSDYMKQLEKEKAALINEDGELVTATSIADMKNLLNAQQGGTLTVEQVLDATNQEAASFELFTLAQQLESELDILYAQDAHYGSRRLEEQMDTLDRLMKELNNLAGATNEQFDAIGKSQAPKIPYVPYFD